MLTTGRSILTKILASAAICSLSVTASAGEITCTAKVKSVAALPTGSLYVEFDNFGGPPAQFCSLVGSFATGTPPSSAAATTIYMEACTAMLGVFLTAKSSGQSIALAFSYPGTAPACSTIILGPYQPNPYPYWISLTN